MDKKTFLGELEKDLKFRGISDIEGIVEEYEDHFNFKMADGFTEQEIAARLGNPLDLAAQYSPPGSGKPAGRGGSRAATATGLTFLFIFAVSLFITFFGWVIVLGAIAIACAALGVCLIGGLNLASLIPHIPGFGAVILGVASLALAVLAGTGTVYCLRYALQMVKAYFHWNGRCMAAAAGRPVSPSIPASPQFKPKTRRLLRTLTGLSLAVFGIAFILGFGVLAVQAGSLEFWHVWGWFVQ